MRAAPFAMASLNTSRKSGFAKTSSAGLNFDVLLPLRAWERVRQIPFLENVGHSISTSAPAHSFYVFPEPRHLPTMKDPAKAIPGQYIA